MKSASLFKKLKGGSLPENHTIRIHRAISWLKQAEKDSNADMKFIALWISFNACYSHDLQGLKTKTEREKLKEFVAKLVQCDGERLYNVFWNIYSGPVRLLIENQFLFEPFWTYQRGEADDYTRAFEKSNQAALQLLSNKNVAELMLLVLERLYCLRNQLIHGGATFGSKLNRTTLRDANNILLHVMPIIIDILLEDNGVDWGEINYPVIK
jgi:hypothetical protein